MPAVYDFYPPAPGQVPPNLATPSLSYRTRVLVVLTSLAVFVVLYFGLVIGSAYLSYWSFATLGGNTPKAVPVRAFNRPPPRPQSDPSVLLVIVGICSGLLFLFLVKGFFKWRRAEDSPRIEVTLDEQPILFAFINQICQDTRAPRPHRVYLTSEVNAAVFYHQSVLNLLLPARKNLIIGLGLVNRLNLSEFKAVLAHEFGHFSQNSMKLGTYVYSSNKIIGEIVFGRDWLDDVVAMLRGVDIRIAIFAWTFTGMLWVLRKSLQGAFKAINFANSALSRQMEFNADLVAVSVTGSDALIHGLARLDLAADALGLAWHDLIGASDRHVYTRDLFYHQTHAADYLRETRKNPLLGEPPHLPADPQETVEVFPPEDTSVPKMWATHPSNHDREVNAKSRYVRSPIDERSPWILFDDPAAVREKVTKHLYQATRLVPGPDAESAKDSSGSPGGARVQPVFQAPDVVQAFIDEEHAETTYNPRYHGVFDSRFLTPGALDDLVGTAPNDFAHRSKLADAHASLYGEDLKARMDKHMGRQKEYGLLASVAGGALELTRKDLSFRGRSYPAAEAGKLLKAVQKELDKDYEWMGVLDRQVFWVHLAMARQLGEETRQELEVRYRFHLNLQDILGKLNGHSQQVQAALGQVAGRRNLTQQEFQWVLDVLREAHEALAKNLKAAWSLRLPALKNVRPGEALGPFLLVQPLVARMPAGEKSIDGKWIGQFMGQLGEVIDKSRRLHFKSLGGILALQEKIAEQWTANDGTAG